MRVGLAEVAERAGVSVATVSRVLNDRPGVTAATRQAVLTAVDVLGYDRPSRLRAREGGLVGVVLPELENPFFPKFAQHVELPLVRAGFTPVLCTQSLGGIHEDDYVNSLLAHGVAGIIFVSGIHAVDGTDPQRYTRLTRRGLPIVMVNGFLPGVPATFVSNNDVRSVELAVGHLHELGHRRIAMALGQRRYVTVQRRIAAFRAAMRSYVDPDLSDRELEPFIACTWYTLEGGTAAANQLFEHDPTAVVCGSDVMALGVVRAAGQRGMGVPADLSVVGSDDGLLMEFTHPPLTTVRQPAASMAAAAVRTLLSSIAGEETPVAEMLFEPELVVRASTARLASRAGHPGTP